MARIAALLAVVCLLAGCTKTSLTLNEDGTIETVLTTTRGGKLGSKMEELNKLIAKACSRGGEEKKAGEAFFGNGMAVEELNRLTEGGLDMADRALDVLRKGAEIVEGLLPWNTITLNGKCLP